MIEKISRGYKIGGLIRYLMGPGRFNEHSGQRVVASWDQAPERHQPPVVEGGFDVTELVTRLCEPAIAGGVSLARPAEGRNGKVAQGPVWHCSLRNHAEDRVLSDAEWAEVVADVLDSTGIAPHGDPGGCRWVAVRHADDHVHIAAVLVRQDTGKRFYPYRDWPQTRKVSLAAEQRLGLTRSEAVDRTAVRHPNRAELEKAARRGERETSRSWLRRAARVAAVQAQDPDEFLRRLTHLGVMTRGKTSESGQLLGYSVAAVGDVNAEGLPVWYSGRNLARDLSLSKLRARWASATRAVPLPPKAGELSEVGQAERSAAIAEARSAMDHASAALAAGESDSDGGEAAGIAHAAEDMVNAIGVVSEPEPKQWDGGAADAYQRAARAAGIGQPRRWGPIAAELRSAAWRLAAIRTLVRGRGSDGGAGVLLVAVAALLAEVAAYHEQRHRIAQARAARTARDVLVRRPPGHPTRPGGPAGGRPEQSRGRGNNRTNADTRTERTTGSTRPAAAQPLVVRGVRPPGETPGRGPRR